MTHWTEQVGFPSLPFTPGMIIKLEARDPLTDAEVAGVTSTRWNIYGYDESEEQQVDAPVPILILPES